MNFLKAMFGNYSKREVKRVQPICDKVLALEDKYAAMSESELKNQTTILKERLANGETTDDILPEAFATCREAGWRVLGMKHFPVQIIGGIVLHQGRIAEMKTGEGKTLVATLPAYLNALTGEGVHIVTVNDYLARRDSEWMGKLYRYLGLSVGLICHDLDNEGRKKAYAADITYGTNNELGFDYLRDNMVVYKENKVQRPHAFAIVDEVDSILIDEARTPLIISGKGDKSTDLYAKADALAKTLKVQRFAELDAKEDMEEYYKENDIDYVVDEKQKTATLTQSGVKKAEEFFGIENLTDPDNLTIQHHVNQAIKANGVMKLDVDYVVKDGEVIIVDEFTGRLMYGRRFNEGLHQAIEAKEGVKVQSESKTLATITFQNYFRLYKKLSGMTGTAQTESEEFQEIYKLDVVEIPTNKPVLRKDLPDSVYKTENGKFHAVIDAIVDPAMVDADTKIFINPTGRFVIGGPNGDSGLTGRKIIVDTYGGAARHGGGAFSGKDCTKVDRSAAYAARYVAKNLVAAGIADRCEIQLSYAIGVAHPTSICVDTFGTGKLSDEKIVEIIRENFDLRPNGIIKMLDLRRPIYKQTASYGHFGRTDINLPWEKLDKVDALKKYL